MQSSLLVMEKANAKKIIVQENLGECLSDFQIILLPTSLSPLCLSQSIVTHSVSPLQNRALSSLMQYSLLYWPSLILPLLLRSLYTSKSSDSSKASKQESRWSGVTAYREGMCIVPPIQVYHSYYDFTEQKIGYHLLL